MLSCPACGRAYPPPTRFCAIDGTALVAAPSAPAARASVVPWIVVGVLGLALIALAAAVLLRDAAPAAPAASAAPAAPAARPVPSAGPADPGGGGQAVYVPPPAPAPAPPAADLRVVSTPTDGFLSIRSAPDGRGTRLDRMLDGETVAVLACGPTRVVDGDAGHWCRVRRQGGQTGWAYDAYLYPAD